MFVLSVVVSSSVVRGCRVDAVTRSPPRAHMCVHTAKMAASLGLFSTLDQCHSGSSRKLRDALFLTVKHTLGHSLLPNL